MRTFQTWPFAGLVAAFCLGSPAGAAEVGVRPDLVDHIRSLKRVYPAEGPSSIIGDLKPYPDDGIEELTPASGDITVFRLSGVIEAGDAEKLKSAFEANPGGNRVIVFESPGGSFLEGFKIADAIRYDLESQDPTITGVYVLGGTQCLSACAIAFALSVDLAHPDHMDGRFIEDGARVGFHMGFLPKDKASQTAEVGQILNLSYDISAAYSRLLSGGANPPSLFRKALKHRTEDSFHYLEGTIEAWEMGFSPVSRGLSAYPAYGYGLDETGAARLCNTMIVHGRAYKSGAELEFAAVDMPENPKLLDAPEGKRSWFSVGTPGGFACSLMIAPDKRLYASVWRGKRLCADGYVPTDEFGQDFCPGKEVGVDPVTAGLFGDAYGCNNGVLHDGIMWSNFEDKSRKHPGSVAREVNLRDAPDLKGSVLVKLQPGQKVDIASCKLLPDFQGVWYEVDTGNQRGWVSARFVAPQLFPFRTDEDAAN